MARKTRKQKARTVQRLSTASQAPVKTTMSAEGAAEAEVTKRGIMKTLIIIALLFILQGAIFMAKSEGMLPF